MLPFFASLETVLFLDVAYLEHSALRSLFWAETTSCLKDVEETNFHVEVL